MSDSIKAARIRELNDQLRCKALGGRIVITRGIEALGADGVREVLIAVARFDDFTEDNDPWGEHDCAVLTATSPELLTPVSVTCEADGSYRVSNLPPGRYTLAAELSGFRTVRKEGILLRAGAKYIDAEVIRDGNIITSRKPDDLPAFMQNIIQAVKEAKPAMAGAR